MVCSETCSLSVKNSFLEHLAHQQRGYSPSHNLALQVEICRKDNKTIIKVSVLNKLWGKKENVFYVEVVQSILCTDLKVSFDKPCLIFSVFMFYSQLYLENLHIKQSVLYLNFPGLKKKKKLKFNLQLNIFLLFYFKWRNVSDFFKSQFHL